MKFALLRIQAAGTKHKKKMVNRVSHVLRFLLLFLMLSNDKWYNLLELRVQNRNRKQN